MIRSARLIWAMFLILAGAAIAGETRGTAEEAQAMVTRAISAYDAQAKAAFAAMNPPSTEFHDRDLCVFVVGPDNRTLVNGQDAGWIGRDLSQTVDPTGKAFGKEMIEKADKNGAWVDYAWRYPMTETVIQKSSWVVHHDGHIFGCGIYKP